MTATLDAVLDAVRADDEIQARRRAFLDWAEHVKVGNPAELRDLPDAEHVLPHITDLREVQKIDRLLDAIGYNGRGPFSKRRARAYLVALEIGAEWLATQTTPSLIPPPEGSAA